VLGLGDGGAHYGMISDASYPSFLLGYWARDRKGKRLSVAEAIRALAFEPARAIGLGDRGLLAVGYKADINVIDHQHVRAQLPRVVYDLPAGGRRLIQEAEGIVATFVSGVPIAIRGKPTGSLPGKLIRGRSPAQPRA
jgi:N-acyl-D-amino-acid deacylase